MSDTYEKPDEGDGGEQTPDIDEGKPADEPDTPPAEPDEPVDPEPVPEPPAEPAP